MPSVAPGPDGQHRCSWCLSTTQYIAYHDAEWGFPVADDRRLFEKLSLEAFQSGLSWRTILEKRDGFRAAFDRFDFDIIAHYGAADIERLLADARIVRHRGKIEATINNARRAREMVTDEGSLAAFFWRFAPQDPAPHLGLTVSPMARDLSNALKKRGWKFVGPTTAHSFIQASGLFNDHASGCMAHDAAAAARAAFTVPR